jgi:hypothetical protein
VSLKLRVEHEFLWAAKWCTPRFFHQARMWWKIFKGQKRQKKLEVGVQECVEPPYWTASSLPQRGRTGGAKADGALWISPRGLSGTLWNSPKGHLGPSNAPVSTLYSGLRRIRSVVCKRAVVISNLLVFGAWTYGRLVTLPRSSWPERAYVKRNAVLSRGSQR